MSIPQTPAEAITTLGRAPARGRMSGRRVLVVGAGQDESGTGAADPLPGNGRAISLLLAREGAAVACADRDLSRARATAQMIVREGGHAVAVAADATDEADVQRMLGEAADQLRGIDGLVLNVGAARGGKLETTEVSELLWTLQTNVVSQFLGLKHGLPVLEQGGSVVMISAIAALRIGPTPLPYDLSKAALAPLLRHGARSGEPIGVRVNMVLPGAIATPMAQRVFGGAHALEWGREGTAWETAYAVLFLLSDEASYVNATTLIVDGGMTAIH